MAILLACQSCGRKFRANEKYGGKRTRCPDCGAEIVIEGKHVADHDVFISYSSKDKQTADAVCAKLEARHLRCWMAPRDIPPGMDWASTIVSAISESRVMVLVFTSEANHSPHVLRELEVAVNRGVTIMPLRVEDVQPSKSIEFFIIASHWLDALTPPLEAHLGRLAETIKGLLRGGRPSEGTAAEVQGPTSVAGRPSGLARLRSRRTLALAGAMAALLAAVVLGALKWSRPSQAPSSKTPPARASEGSAVSEPIPSQELVKIKAQAEVDWERIQGLDRGQGFAARISQADVQRRAAASLFEKRAYPQARAAYAEFSAKVHALVQLEEQRQHAAAQRNAAEESREKGEQVGAPAKRPGVWTTAQDVAKEAPRLFEAGDFVKAAKLWAAAAADYNKATEDTGGLALMETAREAYEDELDGYDLKQLDAEGGKAWKQVRGLVAAAKSASEGGSFAQATDQYNQARKLLPKAGPAYQRLQTKFDALQFLEIPLDLALEFIAEASNAPVIVNWKALAQAGIDPEAKVTLDLRGKGESFEAIMSQTLLAVHSKLGYSLRKGQFVFVSTKANIAELDRIDRAHRPWRRLPKNSPLRVKMQQRISDVSFHRGEYASTLDTALSYLKEVSGASIVVSWGPLEKKGITRETHAGAMSSRSITCEQVLWAILAVTDSSLGYAVVDGNTLLVSTTAEIEAAKASEEAPASRPQGR